MVALARLPTLAFMVALLSSLVIGCTPARGARDACAGGAQAAGRCAGGVPAVDAGVGAAPVGATLPGDHLLLNLAAMRLQVWVGGLLRGCYPVAIGRPSQPTPAGTYRIVARHLHPTWYPPEGGPPVAPGPDNPLGSRFLALNLAGYGLHGTNAPASIGHAVSRGCVRLSEADVSRLWRWAYLEMPVRIVYRRLVVDPAAWGATVMVWPDPYKREKLSAAAVAAATPRPEEVSLLAEDALAWAAEGPVLLAVATPPRPEPARRLPEPGFRPAGKGVGHQASN